MEGTIAVEQKTFEELMARLNRLAGIVSRFCRKAEEECFSKWLDSMEVCQILRISPHTLQTLRDNGTLAYSQIVCKMFYRAEDVRRIMPLVEGHRTLAALKGKTI